MENTRLAYTVWQWGTSTKEQFIQALKDITECGYSYFESVKTAINVFDGDASAFLSLCREYGAMPVSFYLGLSDVEDVILKLPFMAACGIHSMNVSAPTIKGRPATQEELDCNLRAINAIAKKAKEYDIIPCLHPHKNTSVMYESEIDFIMQNTDPALVAFGPDTAHLVAGNCDPVKVIKKYADRVRFIHLKDITGAGAEVAGMQSGVEVYGNFRELGEGIVDFPSVFKVLDGSGYNGFLMAELDRSRFGNKESARISMNYLKKYYK